MDEMDETNSSADYITIQRVAIFNTPAYPRVPETAVNVLSHTLQGSILPLAQQSCSSRDAGVYTEPHALQQYSFHISCHFRYVRLLTSYLVGSEQELILASYPGVRGEGRRYEARAHTCIYCSFTDR